MECLSDLMAKPSSQVVSRCLRVLELLLSNPLSRQLLFASRFNPTTNVTSSTVTSPSRLPVELLSILHRVILTRDSVSLHLASLRILHLVLVSAEEKLKTAVVGTFLVRPLPKFRID